MLLSKILKTRDAFELTPNQRRCKVVRKLSGSFSLLSILLIVAGILCYTVWANNATIASWFDAYGNWVNNTPLVLDIYHWLGKNLGLELFNETITVQASASLLLVVCGIFATSIFTTIYSVGVRFYRLDKKLSAKKAARLQNKLNKYEYKTFKKVEKKLARRNKSK